MVSQRKFPSEKLIIIHLCKVWYEIRREITINEVMSIHYLIGRGNKVCIRLERTH